MLKTLLNPCKLDAQFLRMYVRPIYLLFNAVDTNKAVNLMAPARPQHQLGWCLPLKVRGFNINVIYIF